MSSELKVDTLIEKTTVDLDKKILDVDLPLYFKITEFV